MISDEERLEIDDLSGNLTVPSKSSRSKIRSSNFDTLDEPIRDTFMRDLNAVISKFRHVLNPKQKNNMLKEWDLWGPLLLCTTMATILQTTSEGDKTADGGPEFAEVFLIVWFGAAIVTLNSKLLGGQISFFQSVCVLGYCLTPLTISLVCCKIILILFTQTGFFFFLRIVISLCGFLWATYASIMFMGDSQPEKRKALVIYPMFLFYFIISWLVASHSN